MSGRASFELAPALLGTFADDAGRAALAGGLVGLEKEALRVSAAGSVAPTPHPAALGSPLTHPCITTDFSEALIELVTPALGNGEQVLDLLADLHAHVYRHIGDERLWASSMPCVLHGGADIPLARYGTSNAAQMKTVYRRGLGNRYGRIMQIIAGVHFNFSVDEALWPRLASMRAPAPRLADGGDAERAVLGFRAESYMGMVRNLQRLGWLVPYLFGASPAVCKSFVQDVTTDLESFDANTFFYPHATSLRMGDIGYQNRQEEGTGMKASYDSLDAYIKSLTWAIETPCPQYETIGIKVNGGYEQLNDHVLQIENEYYSTVRPKQITDWMERPTLALRRRGVRYVELRSVDVNAYHPLGIDLETMCFLKLLMLYSLLIESPRIDARERRAIDANQVLAAHQGRAPGLRLQAGDRQPTLRDWAARVLDAMAPLAELLDDAGSGDRFVASLKAQQAKVVDPALTPSARMLAEMRERGEGFAAFARRLTEQHRERFLAAPPSAERGAWLADLAATSLHRQRAIEAADAIDFDEFLRRYFAQSEAHPVELPAPV
ncbi:glutamate--cysteine ligase [Thiohalocapsa sp. ML1]|jgi:glutamate--cysteine ligase|uniref:glutamate--cysteine ligase n=1 Tax=Thiohalocapsa sp. ML1 TaxID=1431688 RepID=UPI0009E68818|nr:glutamate--cysteine ligase [Thiohalocapsa sp. ML1]